ncbi:MAG: hypothetical protein KA419_14310 [Acidobacteria bacterium]|nr:hypothetical protein [Acidobacteriota bacterium]
MKEQVNAIVDNDTLSFCEKIDAIERLMILEALERNNWIKLKAARDLKTTYRVFNYKFMKFGLEKRNGRKRRKAAVAVA